MKPARPNTRQRWQATARRIDALSLRERVFMFLCLAALLIAAADSLVITPVKLEAQTQAKAQLKQNEDLKVLRAQFTASAELLSQPGAPGTGDESARLKARLAQALQQQGQLRMAVDAGFKNMSQGQSQTPLSDLLPTLLKQHERLSLIKLLSLPEGMGPAQFVRTEAHNTTPQIAATAAPAAPPGPSTPASGAPVAAGGLALEWQGLEMQIAGDYLDQLRYLRHLEQALPHLHWGELRVWSQGDGKPVLLQVQVFLPKAHR
ncbi:hypothetical protein [Roseateles koreensis]|uniref:MSHA biogenesis protein MshJ n=1 Tax=Roseateles koreensis TaxID=2987526 RepID=A0ABT5KPZ7_9BURK|nr:hypothetical protein [Roseateles koreensis]MDC8784448.1 hypothetical protein [Roseateles koreensis]